MNLVAQPLSYTASQIATFEDCAARFYHEAQKYPTGLLSTDLVAADVSSALHDALMELHRQMEQAYRQGSLPTVTGVRGILRSLVEKHLRHKRLDRSNPEVAKRLGMAETGLNRTAEMILADMPSWAIEPTNRDPLVWVEAPLDHGPAVRSVQLEDGYLVRTRPDVVGLRLGENGLCRPLVRDYKAKAEVVDPAFDTGILTRALWILAELRNPRCRWFLAGRGLPVDGTSVDLETVNLLHGDSEEFLVAATLTEAQLLLCRNRLTVTMAEMALALEADGPDQVLASPGALCRNWCPYLPFCSPGMDHVRKYAGDEILQERLAGR